MPTPLAVSCRDRATGGVTRMRPSAIRRQESRLEPPAGHVRGEQGLTVRGQSLQAPSSEARSEGLRRRVPMPNRRLRVPISCEVSRLAPRLEHLPIQEVLCALRFFCSSQGDARAQTLGTGLGDRLRAPRGTSVAAPRSADRASSPPKIEPGGLVLREVSISALRLSSWE
jgi:hypothetical protein